MLVKTPLFKSLGWNQVEQLHLQVSRHHGITKGNLIKWLSALLNSTLGWWDPSEFKFGLSVQHVWKEIRKELATVLRLTESESFWELPQVWISLHRSPGLQNWVLRLGPSLDQLTAGGSCILGTVVTFSRSLAEFGRKHCRPSSINWTRSLQ